MQFFTRIDPAKKISRFWLSMVTPTLLGGWSLVREWGRIGQPGMMKARTFDSEKEAVRAEQQGIKKRQRHGYTDQDIVSRWSEIMSIGGSIRAPEKRSQIKSKSGDDLANDNQGNFDF
jgi:predicted DNA-binding WGR domain protein